MIRAPLLLAALLLASGTARAAHPQATADLAAWALGTYGAEHRFEVRLDGAPVGQHVVRFQREDGGLMVEAVLAVDVRWLGVTVYRYRHSSRALWRAGRLARLDIDIDDDGERSRIEARATAADLAIKGPVGAGRGPAWLRPTNHWNPAILHDAHILNTITGAVEPVAIAASGTETVAVKGGDVHAVRHVYAGGFAAESWYDAAGRWTRLRLVDDDGHVIDYLCLTCPTD